MIETRDSPLTDPSKSRSVPLNRETAPLTKFYWYGVQISISIFKIHFPSRSVKIPFVPAKKSHSVLSRFAPVKLKTVCR
jgi:hypothetical protein